LFVNDIALAIDRQHSSMTSTATKSKTSQLATATTTTATVATSAAIAAPIALSYTMIDSIANELFGSGAICEAIACWNAVHNNKYDLSLHIATVPCISINNNDKHCLVFEYRLYSESERTQAGFRALTARAASLAPYVHTHTHAHATNNATNMDTFIAACNTALTFAMKHSYLFGYRSFVLEVISHAQSIGMHAQLCA
jgi:hypothetical protein